MTRFSVLMPTHNRADVIGFAIRSVLAQTETDFELLIVGDGCTDGTADVVAGFSDERIRWFDLPKGPGFGYANRNIALRQARGELVAFAAHDDLIFPDHLARLDHVMKEADAEWAYSRPIFVSTDGVVLPYCTNLTIEDERAYFLDKGNTIPASCVVHRREWLERVGNWPEDVTGGGDWVLWTRIIREGARIAYLPLPTTLHFTAVWRTGRISGARFESELLAIADEAAWWPASMRVPIPEGTKEQAVFFERMTTGGEAWRRGFRLDVRQALDRIAWDDVRVTRRELTARQKNVSDLHQKLAGREAEMQALAKRLDAMEASHKAETDRLNGKLDAQREKIEDLRHRLKKAKKAKRSRNNATRPQRGQAKGARHRRALVESG